MIQELEDAMLGNVESTIIVADALHCQTKAAEAIIKAKANYLFVVKDNNKKFKGKFAKTYQLSLEKPIPMSSILDKNMFDLNNFYTFIAYF